MYELMYNLVICELKLMKFLGKTFVEVYNHPRVYGLCLKSVFVLKLNQFLY